MNGKQYETAQMIMQFSRIFADAMRECMEHSGLLDEGYQLRVNVQQQHLLSTGDTLLNTIYLDRDSTVRKDDFMVDQVCQFKDITKGWYVIDDPIIKSGAAPAEVRIGNAAAEVYRAGKKPEKPFAPDGLWLSSRDNYDPVDCGGKVNDGLAECRSDIG